MKQFFIKPKVFFGESAIDWLSKMSENKVLLVTDPFLHENGMTKKVTDLIDCHGDVVIYSDIKPDPDTQIISRAVKTFLEVQPTAVIAYGGGSTIDATKSMLYFADEVSGGLDRENLTFIAIPTTSGTGSEVTSFSVVTTSGGKVPIVDEYVLPDYAILDASFTQSLPSKVVAETGIDVLTHAIEAYVSKDASYCTDALAEKAAELVFKYLQASMDDPHDEMARSGMHQASCIAGMAFTNSGLGLNHSLAHALGANFHLSHGLSNALLLPEIITYNSSCCVTCAEKYAELAKRIGLNPYTIEDGVRKFIYEIRGFMQKLSLPKYLKELGIEKEAYFAQIDTMLAQAKEDRCTKASAAPFNEEKLREILIRIYS